MFLIPETTEKVLIFSNRKDFSVYFVHLIQYNKGDHQQGRVLLFKTLHTSHMWISRAVDCKEKSNMTCRCFSLQQLLR